MSEADTDPVELSEEMAEPEPEFDRMLGIITDGIIGAVGGAVGTAAATVGLLMATSLGAFDFAAFGTLAELTGLGAVVPIPPVALGYILFLLGGMITWPLLFASAGRYLPGKTFALKGLPFGFVMWTGFAPAFHGPWADGALALYVVFTFGAHLAYGFSLGSVFDYLSKRPDTLV